MIRITALNEESDSSINDEFKVTKEAQVCCWFHLFRYYLTKYFRIFQETIAVSEYMRALKLKSSSSADDALNLFTELLDTQVLHEVS